MLRKFILVSAAIAAFSTATATGASAMRGHWGHSGVVHHNVGFHHAHFFHHRHPFFFRHRFAVVGAPFAFAGDCFVIRRVCTPWGWHWRRIWVCD
jgi:hypothetical protein